MGEVNPTYEALAMSNRGAMGVGFTEVYQIDRPCKYTHIHNEIDHTCVYTHNGVHAIKRRIVRRYKAFSTLKMCVYTRAA